jgi:hypothetical protein
MENSFMALFNWKKLESSDNFNHNVERKFDKIIDENKIFQNNGSHKLSWGAQDKIYRAVNGGFEIVRFDNYTDKDEKSMFTEKRKINLSSWKGDVISGGVAYFGVIIECENALVIALSNGKNYTIKGPITRWRIYPRSINYENHLHVILEDRIEIYSFNNDYFVDQKEKEVGIYYSRNKTFQRNKRWNDFND